MESLKWFLHAYVQFVWQAVIMPLSIIWYAIKFVLKFAASLLGGSSSDGGNDGGGIFGGIFEDLKNIRIKRLGDQ